MKQILILCSGLLAFGCMAQDHNAQISRIHPSISFYLVKADNPALEWYYIDNGLYPKMDTLFCHQEDFKIEGFISYPLQKNVQVMEPFSISGVPGFNPNLIFLPYDSLRECMVFTIRIRKLSDQTTMGIKIIYDQTDEITAGDSQFRFNYIPFKEGLYVFNGNDISHWDVETATINSRNRWDQRTDGRNKKRRTN